MIPGDLVNRERSSSRSEMVMGEELLGRFTLAKEQMDRVEGMDGRGRRRRIGSRLNVERAAGGKKSSGGAKRFPN